MAEFIAKIKQSGKIKSAKKFETIEKQEKNIEIFHSKRENSHTRNFITK